jgi:hydroxyethylthiazole kinase
LISRKAGKKVRIASYYDSIGTKSPLIHNITNYVTVNDVANILLAAGASPIMADELEEAADITAICNALCLNIGTLNSRTIPAMYAAGKHASELGHPIVLDPVGVGASLLRTQTALGLLEKLKVTVVRGNLSELKALAGQAAQTRGVDAALGDAIDEQSLPAVAGFAQDYAAQIGAVVAITGAIDIVADANQAYAVRNGHTMMSRITGSGCMLTALITAAVAANQDAALEATIAAVAAMGVSGQRAADQVICQGKGTVSFRSALIDAISILSGEALDADARLSQVA